MFFDPVKSALIGWLVSMVSRQSGHFFFEPKGYDHVNHATHEHKEEIKIGYNLRRKVLLYVAFVVAPLPLLLDGTFFGIFETPLTTGAWVHHAAMVWLALGIRGPRPP